MQIHQQREVVPETVDSDVVADGGLPAVKGVQTFGSMQSTRRVEKRERIRLTNNGSIEEVEQACFICFDGGDLVVCGCRDCPKVYHYDCIDWDKESFHPPARWKCAWHICNNCENAATYMCYTCTYSLCKKCIGEADFLCIRGNKGFCMACMKYVIPIEDEEMRTKAQVNFDDGYSWECHFKDYWINLNSRLSITIDELKQARKARKRVTFWANNWLSAAYDATDDQGSSSGSSFEDLKVSNSKRTNNKIGLESFPKESSTKEPSGANVGGISVSNGTDWASKELLEFVAYTKNGNTSFLSQLDVRAILLEYIKQNNLRDPCQKSQIVCDSRLKNLFGKACVGHFEMLKLLDSHLFIKYGNEADNAKNRTSDTQVCQVEAEGNGKSLVKAGKDERHGTHKTEKREPKNEVDDHAAIDVHNIIRLHLREVHANPIMDQSYDAERDKAKPDDENQAQAENYMSHRDTGSSTKKNKQISPRRKQLTLNINWPEAHKSPTAAFGQSENTSRKDPMDKVSSADASGGMSESSWTRGRDAQSNSSQELRNQVAASSVDSDTGNVQATVRCGPSSEFARASLSGVVLQLSNDSETDKIWHYQDPAGDIQGPFSMVQLHKWSRTSHFPANMMIWKTKEKQEDSILLIDALNRKFLRAATVEGVLNKTGMVN